MTTDVTKSSASANAIAALGNLKQGLQNVQQRIPDAGGLPFLKMERDGAWVYGQDNVEVEEGSLWAVNPLTFKHGFINWKKRPDGSKEKPELLGEVLVPANQVPPMKETLPDYAQGEWTDCISVQMACVSGEDKGQQVMYKTNSKGGLGALKDLLGAIIAKPDGDVALVPVLQLQSDSYNNKTYGGKTYFPVLEPERWATLDAIEVPAPAAAAPAEAPKTETAPQERRTRTAAAAPQQAANDADDADDEDEDEVTQVAETPADTGERRRRRRAA